ncbi:MAG: hypothetical protein M5U01_06810 [Ardenticatenaceae bacterium]|nr:hypothetical protein [Ardenticatenaceae bacterium]
MTGIRIGTVIVVLVALIGVGIGGFSYGTTVGQARAASVRARFFQERGGGGQASRSPGREGRAAASSPITSRAGR